MKRLLGIGALAAAGILVVLLLWQPARLQRALVDLVLRRVVATTPYRVTVGNVRGSFFTRFTLENVEVRPQGWDNNLAEARGLSLSVAWSALWHRHLRLRELVLTAPVFRLTLDKQHHLVLPASSSKDAHGGPFPEVDRLEIRHGQVRVTNGAATPAAHLRLEELNLRSRLRPTDLTFEQLSVDLGQGQLQGAGKAQWKTELSGELTLTTRHWPFEQLIGLSRTPPAALHLTHSGRWAIQFSRRRIEARSQGALDGAGLRFTVEYPTQGVSHVALQLEPLALGALWRDSMANGVGSLSADLKASIPDRRWQEADVSGQLGLTRQGSAAAARQSLRADVALARGVGAAVLSIRGAALLADATAQLDLPARTVNADFRASASSFTDLGEWVPALREAVGQISAYGTVRGPFADLALTTHAHGQNLAWQTRWIEDAVLDAEGHLGGREPLHLKAEAKNIEFAEAEGPWDLLTLAVTAEGHPASWNVQLDSRFRNTVSAHWKGRLEHAQSAWTATWDELAMAPGNEKGLRSDQPGSFTRRSDGSFEVQNLRLSDGQGFLEIPGAHWDAHRIHLDLDASRLALGPWLHVLSPRRKAEGALDVALHWHGPTREPEGSMLVRVSSGSVQGWAFREAVLQGRLAAPWIRIDDFHIFPGSAGHDVRGEGRLPWHLVHSGSPDLPLQFTLRAPSVDPGLLTALVPGLVIDRGGQSSLNFDISGHYPDVDVRGELRSALPHVELKPAGLDLRDFSAVLRSSGRTVDVERLSARTKKGSISATGHMTLPDLQLSLVGQSVDVNVPKRLQASGDFSLAVAGDLEGPDVSGEVRIHQATYTVPPKEKKTREEPSGGPALESDSPVWEGTTLNIHALWPRGVWYRDGLTKIETRGDLWVQKDEDTTSPYLRGHIDIVRGSYDAYGRDFLLDSGGLVFTGPPDINPILNLRAKYASGGTEVYLDVRGTAKQPQLALSSNPPLPEQDIVSVLVVGRPLNQIGPTQDTTNTSRSAQAAAVAGNVIGGYITRELRASGMDVLGLDIVRVEPTTLGSRLMVGRYIGEKLFVSYGQPLQATAGRVFDLNYYLSRRWTLSGQTGSGAQTGNGTSADDTHLDLEFRYPLNGRDRGANTAPMPGMDTLP